MYLIFIIVFCLEYLLPLFKCLTVNKSFDLIFHTMIPMDSVLRGVKVIDINGCRQSASEFIERFSINPRKVAYHCIELRKVLLIYIMLCERDGRQVR